MSEIRGQKYQQETRIFFIIALRTSILNLKLFPAHG